MMDWKKTLATLAPTLATAIGGPFAPLAGAVVSSVLGGDDKSDPVEALQQAVTSGDPAVYQRIKEADQAFKLRMRELDIKEDQLDVDDRASARDLQAKSGSKMVPALSIIIVGAFLAAAAAVLFGLTTAGSTLVGTILGYLLNEATKVTNFWFGSSHGSKQKTAAITARLPD